MAGKKLRLKYELKPHRTRNSFTFRVHKMDDLFRCKNISQGNVFTASNGWTVRSLGYPEVFCPGKCIFLLGFEVFDDNVHVSKRFGSKSDRDLNIKQIHEALKEWSVEWFKNK